MPGTTTVHGVTWSPPGPGSWELETVHLRGAQPLAFQRLLGTAFALGSRDLGERYGLPIDAMVVRFVNHHCYVQVRGVGEPEPRRGRPSKPPPDLVLKLLARVHPEFRRRNRAARAALQSRLWVTEKSRWTNRWRAETLVANRAVQAVPIEQIDDAALVEHLARVAEHVVQSMRLHFRLIPVHDLPVGRLLNACRRWGIADGDALGLLAGSSPASVASSMELASVGAACRRAGVHPTSLDDVRAVGSDAAVALQAYLDDHSWRAVTQYSPRGLTLHELPDVLLQAIRCAGDTAPPPEAAPDVASVRATVPNADRAHFDELLADARHGYGTRDDNVTLTFLWPVGLLRRALLEVGRRLANRGAVEAVDHVMALDLDEVQAALTADASGVEQWRRLAGERIRHMRAADAAAPPMQLGDPGGAPPDVSRFPRAMAEVTGALTALFSLEMPADPATGQWSGFGVAVGGRTVTGRACVSADPEDALRRLRPGDVLVTTHTTPAYEVVLPITGALVTEHGGLASHAALVARELGLTALLGVVDATTKIPNGAILTVDPSAGVVTIERRGSTRPRRPSDPPATQPRGRAGPIHRP